MSCGDTITADTTLTADLDCTATGNGLIIGAAGITLDGNGHRILTPGTAVSGSGRDDVTIRNLDVSGPVGTNSAYGIHLNAGNRLLIDGVTASDRQTGLFLSGDGNTVQNSLVENAVTGIDLRGVSLKALNNTVRNATEDGIFTSGDDGLVQGNTVEGSGYGVRCQGARTSILGNRVASSTTGLFLHYATNVSVKGADGNDVSGSDTGILLGNASDIFLENMRLDNPANGILGTGVERVTIQDVDASGAAGATAGMGIRLWLSALDVLVDSATASNREIGIQLIGERDVIQDSLVENAVTGMDVRGVNLKALNNTVRNAAEVGIFTSGDDGLVRGNLVEASGTGVRCQGARTRILGNRVDSSTTGLHLHIASSVTVTGADGNDVSGSDTGILLGSASDILLEGMRLDNPANGILGTTVERVTIRDVDASGPAGTTEGMGIRLWRSAFDVLVDSATASNRQYGIQLIGERDVIQDSLVENAFWGMDLRGPESKAFRNVVRNGSEVGLHVNGSDAQIHDNTIEGCGIGLYLNVLAGALAERNLVSGNVTGIRSTNGSSGLAIHHSDIVGNSSNGLYNSETPLVNAENNYWGSADGPAPAGSGDRVTGNVDADPFLTVSAFTPGPLIELVDENGDPVAADWARIDIPGVGEVTLPATLDSFPDGGRLRMFMSIGGVTFGLDKSFAADVTNLVDLGTGQITGTVPTPGQSTVRFVFANSTLLTVELVDGNGDPVAADWARIDYPAVGEVTLPATLGSFPDGGRVRM
ncbi:MAG: NosD domain-containing protein, partial [Elusimicrobiota bacterium]